jgi:hypothetical protein
VFEESDFLLGADEIPMPDLDSAYTLTRRGNKGSFATLLEDHVFAAENAFEVTEYDCHGWDGFGHDPGFCEVYPEDCVDCDGDDVVECYGFCAVAYRFLVVDDCVPSGDVMYFIGTPETESVWYENEGLGFTSTGVEDTGDSCLDDESGCSVSRVGSRDLEGALALFLIAIGLAAGRILR